MRRITPLRLLLTLSLFVLVAPVTAQESMLPVTYETDTGKLLLEIRQLDEPLIYTNTLASGVGTTATLLDRSQIGTNAVVRFERHGPNVLLVRDNTTHRSLSDEPAEQRAVHESFPHSVLAAMPVVEETETGLRVDATDFVLSDEFGVAARLKAAELGNAELDGDRSHVVADRTEAYPENTEIRAALTFSISEPGDELQRHAPDARSLTVEQHHSFIALPESGYEPRAFDPRAGIFPHIFFDFSQGLDTDYRRRWIWRWRLIPSDRDAYLAGELVEPETPIVYYLDPAIPEPYRSAFHEGGEWWNEAFEAAGFRNAFQIRDLPEGVDPMDARYNVIQWVHRRQRGPSIGPHYRDPRTGEIIRSVVRMDSFRSLVNHDIWMGFRPSMDESDAATDSETMAMARRRQHSAHEIGHTLGLAHNFIAATRDRASVMDYPVPLVRLDDEGHVDLSEAYAEGVGAHDRLAIRYAYTWFPDAESEREGLQAILQEFQEQGQTFITGGDAAVSGSIPGATTWVEGNSMLAALERTRRVRQTLIENFDETALNPGEPYFSLNKRFAHVYFHHRSALQGVTKYIGGVRYHYAMQGETGAPTEAVAPAEQREALDRLVEALSPAALRVPERVATLIAPEPFGWDGGWGWHVDEKVIDSPTGPVFDPLDLGYRLVREITDNLFLPQRMARVDSLHSRKPEQPGLEEVMETVIDSAWQDETGDATTQALQRRGQRAVVESLLNLAGNEQTTDSVRATVEARLRELARSLEPGWLNGGSDRRAAHRASLQRAIDRYFEEGVVPGPEPEPVALPWP